MKNVLRHYPRYSVQFLYPWDIRQIVRLERKVFLEPMLLAPVVRKYLSPRTRFLVVKDGPLVIAYFGYEVLGAYAHVLANVTHPSYRRQGLAQFVLTHAEPSAAKMGAKAFIGEVRLSNHPQLEVLKTIGWTKVGVIKPFFGNGEGAHIVMKVFQ